MIAMYIIQALIHALFDTRSGGIALLLNSVALIVSVVLTVNVYGWKMIWLPFVVIVICALLGGTLMGLVMRSQRLSAEGDARERKVDILKLLEKKGAKY